MTYVILQPCCNDASCVAVCPVNCIHPTPDEPEFMRAEMLHIDPATCIDCGACVDECPVDAIVPEDELDDDDSRYLALNAGYFDVHPVDDMPMVQNKSWRKGKFSDLTVAVVGSGPAAFYSALDLHAAGAARIAMFDKLLTPYGLARFGVAPDHQSTKAVTGLFRSLGMKKNFTLHLGVTIGEHVTHAELLQHHDAVIYAVGASSDRRLGVDGEDLPGSHAATEFVAWYNGHPDYANAQFDLSGERAVVVGNGNVALDVARILLSDPEKLAKTDIADHALEALRRSSIREVVVVGRRGAAQAAYTNPEMLSLLDVPDLDVFVEESEVAPDGVTTAMLEAEDTESAVRTKVALAREVAERAPSGASKRLVLRYLLSPKAIRGDGRVESVEFVRNRLQFDTDRRIVAIPTEETVALDAGLVLRSVGYKGRPVRDLPFDEGRGVIPNVDGRVIDPDTGEPIAGVYVTGWIKRGPSGVIGTNKKCAVDTVDALLQDHLEGILTPAGLPAESLISIIEDRAPDALDYEGWSRIDKAERSAGKERSRPRVKFVDVESMLAVARRS
ncbi:FAD-dependent oxidoreductase [Rhodococcus sp. P1Y]|uniref:FAD-dependent oxidoreductase n=1 Tax=Rhodococcus sp. P1Y TaxID=1302308 RepID=UPI000EB33445|nr:FAD-dependent oxidoreductase [Rhodococcus sp. P1Y]AYJ50324.1 ferredoxin [Rhodococcus sp. P1Y]